ncbi:MAG: hypothetical protein LBB34_03960 [Holosporales bacterium]|jgi:hypothetical protein|nr:hypothetical protein [Holosporales bacterium]
MRVSIVFIYFFIAIFVGIFSVNASAPLSRSRLEIISFDRDYPIVPYGAFCEGVRNGDLTIAKLPAGTKEFFVFLPNQNRPNVPTSTNHLNTGDIVQRVSVRDQFLLLVTNAVELTAKGKKRGEWKCKKVGALTPEKPFLAVGRDELPFDMFFSQRHFDFVFRSDEKEILSPEHVLWPIVRLAETFEELKRKVSVDSILSSDPAILSHLSSYTSKFQQMFQDLPATCRQAVTVGALPPSAPELYVGGINFVMSALSRAYCRFDPENPDTFEKMYRLNQEIRAVFHAYSHVRVGDETRAMAEKLSRNPMRYGAPFLLYLMTTYDDSASSDGVPLFWFNYTQLANVIQHISSAEHRHLIFEGDTPPAGKSHFILRLGTPVHHFLLSIIGGIIGSQAIRISDVQVGYPDVKITALLDLTKIDQSMIESMRVRRPNGGFDPANAVTFFIRAEDNFLRLVTMYPEFVPNADRIPQEEELVLHRLTELTGVKGGPTGRIILSFQ